MQVVDPDHERSRLGDCREDARQGLGACTPRLDGIHGHRLVPLERARLDAAEHWKEARQRGKARLLENARIATGLPT